MSRNKLFTLTLLFSIIIFSRPAHADMVGLAYMLIAGVSLYFVYPISLLIEAFILTKIYQYERSTAAVSAIVANGVSLAVGIGIFIYAYDVYSLLDNIYPPILSLTAKIGIFYILSVLIEWPIYYKFKMGRTGLNALLLTIIVNLCSYLILSLPLYIYYWDR